MEKYSSMWESNHLISNIKLHIHTHICPYAFLRVTYLSSSIIAWEEVVCRDTFSLGKSNSWEIVCLLGKAPK